MAEASPKTDSPQVAHMKDQLAELEAKGKRLAGLDQKSQPPGFNLAAAINRNETEIANAKKLIKDPTK